MKNKIFLFLISVLIVVGMLTVGTAAEETGYVAQIGETGYATLPEAVAAAQAGDTVTLVKDVDLSTVSGQKYALLIDKAITVDLGGNTVTGDAQMLVRVTAGATIKNGTINKTGTSGYALYVFTRSGVNVENCALESTKAGILNYATSLTLNSCAVKVTSDKQGIVNYGYVNLVNTTVNVIDTAIYPAANNTKVSIDAASKLIGDTGINDTYENCTYDIYGTIQAKSFAVDTNGSYTKNSTINIYEGAYLSADNGPAIYLAGGEGSVTNIYGGTIVGVDGIEIRAGSLNISGDPTIKAADNNFSCDPNSNGFTTHGAAIAIAQHTTKQDITVTITGGTFEGVVALSESNPQENDPAPQVTLSVSDGNFSGEITVADTQGFISGGTFSEEVAAEYCADGYLPEDNGDGTYGVFGDSSYVAIIGNKGYTTLEAAVKAAQAGDTVTLVADVELSKELSVAKNITLDLNGNTITNNNTNNAIATTATLTVKNGTVICEYTGGRSVCVRAGGDVTLENVNCVAANPVYVVSGAAATIKSGEYTGTLYAGGSLSISGGTFSKDYTKYCVNGNYCLKDNDKYVVTLGVATVSNINYGFATLEAAVKAAQAGDTVTLVADVELSKELSVAKNITLDLNGNTITNNNTNNAIATTATLTVKNGTVISGYTGGRSVCVRAGGDVTLENVNCVAANPVYVVSGAAATIKSGEYTGTLYAGGSLSISGGTFSKNPKEAYLAEGCISKLQDSGYYLVGKAYTVTYNGKVEKYLDKEKVEVTDESENFSGWYIDDTCVSTKSTYVFWIHSDITLVAKYDIEPVQDPVLFAPPVVQAFESNDKNYILFSFTREVDTVNYTVVTQGIIYNKGDVAEADFDEATGTISQNETGSRIYSASALPNGTTDLKLSVKSTTDNYSAKAFVILQDNEGNYRIVYSDTVTVNYNGSCG